MARRYTLRRRAAAFERTRQSILTAARAQLARVGYAALRVEDVARRARVARRTVYAHFPTRADLADAALRERADTLRDRVARWRPRGSDPETIVEEIVAFHERTYRQEYALLETLSEGAPQSGRVLLRALDAERLRNIARTMQALAARGDLHVRALEATALLHAALSYPAWRVALTGPAGRRAPRIIASALKTALL